MDSRLMPIFHFEGLESYDPFEVIEEASAIARDLGAKVIVYMNGYEATLYPRSDPYQVYQDYLDWSDDG